MADATSSSTTPLRRIKASPRHQARVMTALAPDPFPPFDWKDQPTLDDLIFNLPPPQTTPPVSASEDVATLARQRLDAIGTVYNNCFHRLPITLPELVIGMLMALGVGLLVVWVMEPDLKFSTLETLVSPTGVIKLALHLQVTAMLIMAFFSAWGHWVLKWDHRFAGAHPRASIPARVHSLWNDPGRQWNTDWYYYITSGTNSPIKIGFNTKDVKNHVEDVLEALKTHEKARFETLSRDEQVRIVCCRAMFLSLHEAAEEAKKTQWQWW